LRNPSKNIKKNIFPTKIPQAVDFSSGKNADPNAGDEATQKPGPSVAILVRYSQCGPPNIM
jgi:hypothetical protein